MASRHAAPPARAARLGQAGPAMWITRPATVDNYRESLFAVCGCPVDGAGTTCIHVDRSRMGSPDSSTSGHTLSGTFCIQQALETKVFFPVIHRKGTTFTTTTCIHKEKGKPIDRLPSIPPVASKPIQNSNPISADRCDGIVSRYNGHAGLRNLRTASGYKAHVPAQNASRYHVALGATPWGL